MQRKHISLVYTLLSFGAAFDYSPSGIKRSQPWDIWKDQRSIMTDCYDAVYDPVDQSERGLSVEACQDACLEICQDPKTKTDMANCVGRMQLLQCKFGYWDLEVYDTPFDRYCLDKYLSAHTSVRDPTLLQKLRSATQTKIFIKIDPSLDLSCREGSSLSMSLTPFLEGEKWPDWTGINCTDPWWENLQKSQNWSSAKVQHGQDHLDLGHPVLMASFLDAWVDLIGSYDGRFHLEIALSGCETAAIKPSLAQNHWLGFVLQVKRPPMSFRSLYSISSSSPPDTDTDFWRWKGPFAKW